MLGVGVIIISKYTQMAMTIILISFVFILNSLGLQQVLILQYGPQEGRGNICIKKAKVIP